MREREFEVTLGADGSVQVHVKGYKGRGCLEAMRFFEQAVGPAQGRRLTAEFYDPEEEVRYHIDSGKALAHLAGIGYIGCRKLTPGRGNGTADA